MTNNTPRKAAIVLGGTSPHAELCRRLKSRGYYTILIDYLEDPPARQDADEYVRESTLNADAVHRIAIHTNADLVIATCVDQANVTACDVLERLGKRPPYSSSTARSIANKLRMKTIMRDHGIPTTPFVQIKDAESRAWQSLRFPLVVKPCDCNGSKGVRRCDNPSDVVKNIPAAIRASRTGEALIEEFIEGREIAFDSFATCDTVHILMTRERRKIPTDCRGIQQIVGSTWPAQVHAGVIEQCARIARSVANAFHLENTPLIFQTIVANNAVNVIEFAPRIGGGENHHIIRVATGVDPITLAVDSFEGIRPEIPITNPSGVYFDNYLYTKPCVFGRLSGLEEQVGEGKIVYFKTYKKPGDIIGPELTSSNRVGAFAVQSPTEAEGLAAIQRIISSIEVLDIHGQPVLLRSAYP
jgi:biotin carboxylase